MLETLQLDKLQQIIADKDNVDDKRILVLNAVGIFNVSHKQ
jgi:hypothetical protein